MRLRIEHDDRNTGIEVTDSGEQLADLIVAQVRAEEDGLDASLRSDFAPSQWRER